jgi:hypothetical protein
MLSKGAMAGKNISEPALPGQGYEHISEIFSVTSQISSNMFSAIISQPSHIIYGISSIKWQWIARFTQRFFNTTGVSLCFQSQRAWERIFAEAGFDVAFKEVSRGGGLDVPSVG